MKEQFPRKCDATGVGMHKGYVAADGMHHFSEKKYLIEYLRTLDIVNPDASDEFLLTEAYLRDEYYYTEWEIDDCEYWYEYSADGTLIMASIEESLLKNIYVLYDEDRDKVYQWEDGVIITYTDFERAYYWEKVLNEDEDFDCNYEAMQSIYLPDHHIDRLINHTKK
jgi:hypothetical protein